MKSTWKRCLSLMLALMLVASCVPVTVFAEENVECSHEYVDEVTPPGCNVGGYTTHSCSLCSYSYTDSETEPTGHSYGEGVVTQPSCEASGFTTYTCTICGGSYSDSEVAALGHSYGEGVITEPTCEKSGFTTYTCTICGGSYSDSEVAALGHSYGEGVITEPTCEKSGFTTYTCTICGGSYSDSEVAALGHSYGEGVITEPTCEENGFTTYTCTTCGGSYTDSEVAALDHQYEDGVCTVCGGQEPALLADEEVEEVLVSFIWKDQSKQVESVTMMYYGLDTEVDSAIMDAVPGTAFSQAKLPANADSVDFEVTTTEGITYWSCTFSYSDGEGPAENDCFAMNTETDENGYYEVELLRDYAVVANPVAMLAEMFEEGQKSTNFATLQEAFTAANASTAGVVDIYLQKSVTLDSTITIERSMGVHSNSDLTVTATNNACFEITSGWPLFDGVTLETSSDYGYKVTGEADGCMLNNSPIYGGANTIGIYSNISGGDIQIYGSDQGESGFAYLIQGKIALEIAGENTQVRLAGGNASNRLKGSNPDGVVVVNGDGNSVSYFGEWIENTTTGGKAFSLNGDSQINPGDVFKVADGEPVVYGGLDNPMPNEGAVLRSNVNGSYYSSLQSAFYDAELANNLEYDIIFGLCDDILLTETAVLGRTNRPVMIQMNSCQITSAENVTLDTLLKVKTDFTLDYGNPQSENPDHKIYNPAEGGRCIDFGDPDDARHYDLWIQGVPVEGGLGGYGIVSYGRGRIILPGSLVSSVDIQGDHMELHLQGATLTGAQNDYADDFATIRIQASDVNVTAAAAEWDTEQMTSLNAGYSQNGEKRHIFSVGSKDKELKNVRFWISEGTVLMGDIFDDAGNVDVETSDLQFHQDQVVDMPDDNDPNIKVKLEEEGLAWEEVMDGETNAPNGYIRIAPVALFIGISNPIKDENGETIGNEMDERDVSYFSLHEAIEDSMKEEGYNRVIELLAETTLNKPVEVTKGVGIQGRQGAMKLRLVDGAYFDVKGEVFQLFWIDELATSGEYAIKVFGEKSQVFLGGVHMTNYTTKYGIYVAETAEGAAVMMNAGNDGEPVTGVTVNGSAAGVKVLADHVTVCLFNDDGDDAVKVEGNVALDVQADHADVQIWAKNAEVNGLEMAINLVGDNTKVQYGAEGNTGLYGNNAEGIVQITGDGNSVDVWNGNLWNAAAEGSPVFKLDGDSRFQYGAEDADIPNIGAKVRMGRCYFGGLQSAFDFVAQQEIPEEEQQPGNQFPLNMIDDLVIDKPVVLEKADLDVMLYLNGYTISQEQTQTGDYAMITNKASLHFVGDHTFEGKIRGTISYRDTSEIHSAVSYTSSTIRNLGQMTICHVDVINESSEAVSRYGNAYALNCDSTESDVRTEIGIGANLQNAKGYAIRQNCGAPDHSNVLNILNGELNGGIELVSVGPDANKGELNIDNGSIQGNDAAEVLYIHGTQKPDYDQISVQIQGGFLNGSVSVDNAFTKTIIPGMVEVYSGSMDENDTPILNEIINPATFGEEPEARLIEQGYEAVWNEDSGAWNIAETIMAAFVDLDGNGMQDEGEQSYKYVDDALAAAETGQTVKLLNDCVAKNIVIPIGVTLDLQACVLTANYVIGFKGSYLIANPNSGKMIVSKDSVALSQEGYINEDNQYVLPIWDPNQRCYLFSLFVVNTENEDRGLYINEETEEIYFQFKHQATKAINQGLLCNGASDNAMRVVIHLEWSTENGVAYQDFVYNDDQVGLVAVGAMVNGVQKYYDYTFRLTGYNAMNIDLNTLTVRSMIITDSDITAFGKNWNIENQKGPKES